MKNKVKNIAAVILAGGKNSRMSGMNKAFIQINGVPIIQRTITLLNEIFEEIIIVTNFAENFRQYGDKVLFVKDLISNAGPLAGIHSALTHTTKDAVFVVACDMPFLCQHVISVQVEYSNLLHEGCLVPRIGSSIEPLHAIYFKNVKDTVGEYLVNGNDKSIRNFFTTVNVNYWDLPDNPGNRKILSNVNTPDDLKAIAENYSGDFNK